ncbi:MAG: hypothetical protein B7Y45_10610 [Sphingomonas sp. 28-66-16]|nr:MAG: hypothetical protein B7Y45_10610 [Sphingomonas sp. 28-66-16]
MVIGVASAGIARAESVRLIGHFPADYREPSLLKRMGVDRIDGPDGGALGFALERALANRGHYSVVSLDRRGGDASLDGVLSGLVSTEINEARVTQEHENCVETKKDAFNNDQCVRKEKQTVYCRQRTIDMTADLRITRESDGGIAYSTRKPRQHVVTWCPGDSAPGAVDGVVRGMTDSIADEVAREISPYTENYAPRFYESRDGLPKEFGDRFKAAVRRTQTDLTGACAEMAAIDQATPQFAVAYDVGICAEARGEYEAAIDSYRRAATLRPRDTGDFNAAMNRVRKLIVQRDDERAQR